jgi:hypothetical protein
MSVLEQARKAVFGETWALPIGVAAMLGVAVVLKHVAADSWVDFGGPLLLAGAAVILVVLVRGGAQSAKR